MEPPIDLARDTSDAIDDALGDDILAGFALTRQAALLLHEGQPEESLDCARAAIERLEALPGPRRVIEVQEVVLLAGRALMRLDRFEELDGLMAAHHSAFPSTTGTLFLEGLAARALGQTGRAADLLRTAYVSHREPEFAEPIPEVVGTQLPNLLGATLLDNGELAAAAEAFHLALARDPEDLDARLGLIGVEHAEGRVESMLRELEALVEPHGSNPRVWLTGAIVLSRAPELADTAMEWLGEAHRRFPGHPEIKRRLAEVQLQTGGAEEALRTLSELPADVLSLQLEAARVAGALACGEKLPEVSAERTAEIGEHVLEWFRRWAVFGAVRTLDRALMDIDRAERELPGIAGRTAEWLDGIGQQEAAAGVRERT
jgi:tetratricopeptide (TPR) repeat protein